MRLIERVQMRNVMCWMTVWMAACCLVAGSSHAESDPDIDIVYPPGANVFNVVTDGGVDNTGKTDVTGKLQTLIAERSRSISILYFPKGEYLVSGSLVVKIDRSRNDASHSHGPWIVGEKRSETVIRLKDGTWPKPIYDLLEPTKRGEAKKAGYPKALDKQVVLNTGDSTNTTFNKIIRNLTINTGSNNAGAIGVQYCTSNSGFLGEVTIVSEDGQGLCGLALAGVENGPGQVRNVFVKGFDVGLYNVAPYTMSVSHVTLQDINQVGVLNGDPGMMAGENFNITMKGEGPAIRQDGRHFALLGGDLRGHAGPAIEGEDNLYLSDVKAAGFAGVLEDGAMQVDEFVGGRTAGLFNKQDGSLRLPIKRTPYVPYETDMSKWANLLDYGADHVTGKDGKHDSTEAFEKALADKTKTHIMVPYGGKPWKSTGYEHHKVPDPRGRNFWIRKSLVIPPHVTRIVGAPGHIRHEFDDQVRWIVEGDSDVPLFIEGMNAPPLIVRGSRTVVLSHSSFGVAWQDIPKDQRGYDLPPYIVFEGTGDVFMNDVSSPFQIKNAQQKVFVRFYNDERDWWFQKPTIDIYAGQLWILGWKSEGFLTRIMMEDGTCEVIGYNSYSQSKDYSRPNPPLFIIRGGRFAAVNTTQHGVQRYSMLISETRGDQTREFKWKEDNNGVPNLELLAAFDQE